MSGSWCIRTPGRSCGEILVVGGGTQGTATVAQRVAAVAVAGGGLVAADAWAAVAEVEQVR